MRKCAQKSRNMFPQMTSPSFPSRFGITGISVCGSATRHHPGINKQVLLQVCGALSTSGQGWAKEKEKGKREKKEKSFETPAAPLASLSNSLSLSAH